MSCGVTESLDEYLTEASSICGYYVEDLQTKTVVLKIDGLYIYIGKSITSLGSEH